MQACAKAVYTIDFGPTCSNNDTAAAAAADGVDVDGVGVDHKIVFIANIFRPCKLYVTVMGNGLHHQPALCDLDIYVNGSTTLAHHASMTNHYRTQRVALLLPNTLYRGKHNLTIIGRQLEVGRICNIASIFCI